MTATRATKTKWQTTQQAGIPCGVCGKTDTCTVAPDRTAFKCFRDGGRVTQVGNRPAPKPAASRSTATRSVGKKTGKESPAVTYRDADEARLAAAATIRGRIGFSRYHVYRDAHGTEVMRVCRFDLTGNDKTFRPIHRVAGGQWKLGDPPGPLPLYRLDGLGDAPTVYVCEGEKAADAAEGLGLVTTTSAHGAAAAAKTDWAPPAGRDVVILPDHDEPGRKYAREVATILVGLDPPARVKVVALPGLPEGGDVVEFIQARPEADKDGIRGEITALAAAVPPADVADLTGGPVLVCMADVQAKPVEWLWRNRIALGCITLLVGSPGEGKSYLTTDMAARVTTGTPFPDGSPCPYGSVVMICAEDDPARTIRPRLDAHGADVRRVHLFSIVRRVGEDGKRRDVLFDLRDVANLEKALIAHPDGKLVVVDPVGSFLGTGTDAHRDNDVRAVLAPVAKLAEQHGCAVLIVCHRRKAAGATADELAMGSRAFTGIARTAWHVTPDVMDNDRKLFLAGKNNLARKRTTCAGTSPACSA